MVRKRYQLNAFLLVGVSPRDDGKTGIGLASIVGEVWNAGRDVDKVAGLRDHVLAQVVTVPHAGFPAQDVYRGLVLIVTMGLSASSRGDVQKVHAQVLRTNSLGGDSGKVVESLLAGVRCHTRVDHGATGGRSWLHFHHPARRSSVRSVVSNRYVLAGLTDDRLRRFNRSKSLNSIIPFSPGFGFS